MQVRTVPFENAEETQDEGEEVEAVKFEEKVVTAVDVLVLVDHTYMVPHTFRTINGELRERLKPFIRTNRIKYIRGLVVLMAKKPVRNN